MNNDTSTVRRTAAAALLAAAGCAVIGFSGLGATFDYPAILDEPTAAILAAYRRDQAVITACFAVLVLGAALLAPIAVLLGRLAGTRRRVIAVLGVTAAAVQVIGLSRWLVLVPRFSDDAFDPARRADAHRQFELAHSWLGHAVGETLGYALTAAFTIAVTGALAGIPRWLRVGGFTAAGLVATGVVVPLGVDVAALTNFVGYLLWTAWLVCLAAHLLISARRPSHQVTTTARGATDESDRVGSSQWGRP
jgi:hypothetical protein